MIGAARLMGRIPIPTRRCGVDVGELWGGVHPFPSRPLSALGQ